MFARLLTFLRRFADLEASAYNDMGIDAPGLTDKLEIAR